MDFGQALRVAVNSLRTNPLRSALTMMGMAIGVGAVIMLTSLGNGVQSSITKQFNSLGTNLVFVDPGTTRAQGGVTAQAGAVQTITYDDARAIADPINVPSAALVSPEVFLSGQFIYQAQNTTGTINAVTPTYGLLHDYQVSDGEWFNDDQLQASASVAVLGASVARSLFPTTNPIGAQVRIAANGGRSGPFTVIGVGEAKGGSSFNNPDTAVYVPLTTALNKLSRTSAATGAQTVNHVSVQAIDEQHIQSLQDEIAQVLLRRHHITDPTQADFSIASLEDQLKRLQQVTSIFTVFLGFVAGISLLVGGIGIMNIMIVSVTERTREIGIRKAVGARRADILRQFLVEAIVVALVGGGSGITGGVILSRIGSSLSINGNPLPILVSPQAVIVAAGVSAAIGISFGLYPAMRAARMSPIQALRYE